MFFTFFLVLLGWSNLAFGWNMGIFGDNRAMDYQNTHR